MLKYKIPQIVTLTRKNDKYSFYFSFIKNKANW